MRNDRLGGQIGPQRRNRPERPEHLKDALYLAWLRGRSRLRGIGVALLVIGGVVGSLGWFALVLEATTDADNIAMAAVAALFGTSVGNLGFWLILFGLLEDRIYQSEAVILAEVKGHAPTD